MFEWLGRDSQSRDMIWSALIHHRDDLRMVLDVDRTLTVIERRKIREDLEATERKLEELELTWHYHPI